MLWRTIFSFWPLWICYIEPYISSLSFRWLVNCYCALSCSMLYALHVYSIQYTVLHPYGMVIIHTLHSMIHIFTNINANSMCVIHTVYVKTKTICHAVEKRFIQLFWWRHTIAPHKPCWIINEKELNIIQLNRQTTVLRKRVSVYFPYIHVNAVWRMAYGIDDEINEPLFRCCFHSFVWKP